MGVFVGSIIQSFAQQKQRDLDEIENERWTESVAHLRKNKRNG